MKLKQWIAAAALVAIAVGLGTSGDRLRACGPFISYVVFTNRLYPADRPAYARGELGIVQPSYARWYLALAYRRLSGVAANDDAVPPAPPREYQDSVKRWFEAASKVTGPSQPSVPADGSRMMRQLDFSYAAVCTDGALDTAVDTLTARTRAYGAESAAVRDWVAAQNLVFAHCDDERAASAGLPPPAPTGVPEIFVKDRAYQQAAALFYMGRYADAESAFRTIAGDAASPWRSMSRYLVARSLIRRAFADADEAAGRQFLGRAAAELDAILQDPADSGGHQRAQSLRDYVTAHLRPVDRLHAAARQLMTAARPARQDFVDYALLMDKLVSPDTEYDYDSIDPSVRSGDDLTDWITTMQGYGSGAAARAVQRFRATGSSAWLIAALWRVDPKSSDAQSLIDAAAALPADSAAMTSSAFLRARLLIARGETASARAALAGIPDTPGPRLPAEAVNMFRALRFELAATFDEALRFAPREPVLFRDSSGLADGSSRDGLPAASFDVDAAVFFSEHLPLNRLVEASSSSHLPERLRLKVAIAAWTRAVELRDDRAGLAVAPILKALAPQMSRDLDSYSTARDSASRHFAGVLTLLRWPGMKNYVTLTEEQTGVSGKEPRNSIAIDAIGINWWCGFEPSEYRVAGPYDSRERPMTTLTVQPGGKEAPPAFVTAAERVATATEWQRLAQLGSGPKYLATEAVAWADAEPRNPLVAEALARAVRATRHDCGESNTARASQLAFQKLHRLFPNSSWAKQTRFWYTGRSW